MDVQIGWIDIAMLVVMAVSFLAGAARGFTFEIMSLAGWFAAWFAGVWAGPLLAPHLPVGEPGGALNRGAGFALAFVVVIVLWSLVARAISSLIGKTPLRPLDRLLGAAFGLARGVLILLAAAAVVAYTPLARSDAWQRSRGAAWSSAALHEVLPWIAPAAARLPELPRVPPADRV